MKRGEKLYEGKSKNLYQLTYDYGDVVPNLIEMEYSDRISAQEKINGKGAANNLLTTMLFKVFNKGGIRTHYIAEGTTPSSMIVRECVPIKLKVIIRNRASGSFCRRYGVSEGMVFDSPVLEFRLKDDKLNNPMILEPEILELGLASLSELADIKKYVYKINDVALAFFRDKLALDLIDFKAEFAIERHGRVFLSDEFSLDTCQLWDASGANIFRKEMTKEEAEVVYRKILDMLKKIQ